MWDRRFLRLRRLLADIADPCQPGYSNGARANVFLSGRDSNRAYNKFTRAEAGRFGVHPMVMPDHWIQAFGEAGGITPFNPEHINPASYDVTLGDHWICPTRQPEEIIVASITLFPGEVVLATTQECIAMPRDVVCDLKLKSSLGRLWLNHSLSGWIDPNFKGQVTLELQNLGPYPRVLNAGMRIAQLVFMAMQSPPLVAYGEKGRGHYQGQSGATRAWSEDFFPQIQEKPRK